MSRPPLGHVPGSVAAQVATEHNGTFMGVDAHASRGAHFLAPCSVPRSPGVLRNPFPGHINQNPSAYKKEKIVFMFLYLFQIINRILIGLLREKK